MRAVNERDRAPSPSNVTPPSVSDEPLEPPTIVDPGRASVDPQRLSADVERYRTLRELGRGGMGRVQLCRDTHIGRDVAKKVILDGLRQSNERTGRFLREARVQGQLEHPSIVPVYDVGAGEDGALYFTMKCLRGMTLSKVLRALAKGDPEVVRATSRRKLLSTFSSLCQAVEYAHSRGVLHRDIKPSNIMLGDFGEVYLLDWGIAKVLESEGESLDLQMDLNATMPGEIIGTLGYVAPEQARGKVAQLDARTEVYALGCILFEILTLRPLHEGHDRFDLLKSTTLGCDARASVRAPERDIPPELDRICVRATLLDQAERYPTVAKLREDVERFLDGDRNIEMRRDLAAEHAASAEVAVEQALRGEGAKGEQARRTALREVGRALALDPDNQQALSVLEKVFTAPPREVPKEVTTQLRVAESQRYRLQLRDAIVAELAGMAFAFPAALWMGVREWTFILGVIVLTIAAIALKVVAHRNAEKPIVEVYAYFAFLFNAFAVVMLTRAWGPLFVMPVLLLVFANGYGTTTSEGHRKRVLATTFVVQIGAVLVEYWGLLPRSYSFAGNGLTVLPRGLDHTEVPSLVGLTLFSLFMIFMPMRLSGRLLRLVHEAEQRALVNAWQLGQLLPKSAQRSGASSSHVGAVVAFVLVSLLGGGSAHAYCRTSTTYTETHEGHVCSPPKSDDSGVPVAWWTPRVTYSIQEDASAQVNFSTAQKVVRSAFDTWMGVDCGDGSPRIEVVETEPAVCGEYEYNKEKGNANVIFFVDSGWPYQPSALALTNVTFQVDTGEIYDADMAINTANFQFTTGDTMVESDLLSVVTHEAGHFLGLAHSPVGEATMRPGYTLGSKDLRDLAADDRAGICDVYPPGAIAEVCDSTPRHGFSVECAENQPAPDPEAEKSKEDRCCCTDGFVCENGECVATGCGCEVWKGKGDGRISGFWGLVTLGLGVAVVLRRARARFRAIDP